MRAQLIVLLGALMLVTPAASHPLRKSHHAKLCTSKRCITPMRHPRRDDDGVSVVLGSPIKRNAVGEVMAPQSTDIGPKEKPANNSPASATPPGPEKHP